MGSVLPAHIAKCVKNESRTNVVAGETSAFSATKTTINYVIDAIIQLKKLRRFDVTYAMYIYVKIARRHNVQIIARDALEVVIYAPRQFQSTVDVATNIYVVNIPFYV